MPKEPSGYSEAAVEKMTGEILYRLHKHLWVREYSLENGLWNVKWTKAGFKKAQRLKELSLKYNLLDRNTAPMAFEVGLENPTLFSGIVPLCEEDALFWKVAVGSLGIHGVEESLFSLVQVVCEYS